MFIAALNPIRRWFLRLAVLVGVSGGVAFAGLRPDDPDEVFFREGAIPKLRIEITPEEMTKLNKDNRSFVRCTIREGEDFLYRDVGIHLKGAAGSYGFGPVSPIAGKLEDSLIADRPEEFIRADLDALVDICRRIRSGSKPE